MVRGVPVFGGCLLPLSAGQLPVKPLQPLPGQLLQSPLDRRSPLDGLPGLFPGLLQVGQLLREHPPLPPELRPGEELPSAGSGLSRSQGADLPPLQPHRLSRPLPGEGDGGGLALLPQLPEPLGKGL